jgi:hypothetical protein
METEGSLPCTQVPANGPYSELFKSSPNSQPVFIYDSF